MIRRLVAGGVSGFVATVPMTVFMLAADRFGWKGRKGPEVIVRHGLDAVDASRSRGQELAAIAAGHLGFGTGSGALYGMLAPAAAARHPVLRGTVFGIALWVVNYQGWVPAAGILPPVPQDLPDRQARLFGAHIVYGAVLGSLRSRLGR